MTKSLVDTQFLMGGAPDRHAEYAGLRGADEVFKVTLPSGVQAWLVTGYDAVRQALADPRLQGRTGAVGDRRRLSDDVDRGMNSHMLNTDPPQHTRLRRLLSAVFTRSRIEQMRPRIQRVTDELLDAMSAQDEVDLLQSYATRLPVRILTGMLGVPDCESDRFLGWTATLTTNGVPITELNAAAAEMLQYSRQLLERKRQVPDDGLLSALVADRGADRLAEHELTSMVFLLLIAGQETTVNLIANATLALLSNPTQLARLRADASLVPNAIEEFLRYESPVHAALRRASAPIRLAGVDIPEGAVVIVSLLAANRDPSRFASPDEFDIARKKNPHVAFGYGIHHCLGAPLARVEGEIAMRALIERFPRLRLATTAQTLEWRVSVVMNGLERLPVRLR